MKFRLSRNRLLSILVLSALVVTVAVASASNTCVKRDGLCTSTTSMQVFTGSPTVICQAGHPVVEITSSATCGHKSSAGPVVLLRCGTSSEPFSYSGGGVEHKIGLQSGKTWEDALNGDCRAIVYTNSTHIGGRIRP